MEKTRNGLHPVLISSLLVTGKVIIKKSCGEGSLMEQDTIENVSTVWDRVPKEDAAIFESDTFL